jgi:hypothetical protein
MKIECQWNGCDGIIDLQKDFDDYLPQKKKRIPFLIHTIVCPKCGNPVGGLDIGPDPWITVSTKDKPEKVTIHNPKTKECVSIENYQRGKFGVKKALNPYLKKWARI